MRSENERNLVYSLVIFGILEVVDSSVGFSSERKFHYRSKNLRNIRRKSCNSFVSPAGSNDHWERHKDVINLSMAEPEWDGIAFRFPDYGKGLYRQSDFRADITWADVIESINIFAARGAPEAVILKHIFGYVRSRLRMKHYEIVRNAAVFKRQPLFTTSQQN